MDQVVLDDRTARVVERLGLHMLLLDVGRIEVVDSSASRIDFALQLAPGRRAAEWVAATCRLLEDPLVPRIRFDRSSGAAETIVTCDYLADSGPWTVTIRLAPTLQEH